MLTLPFLSISPSRLCYIFSIMHAKGLMYSITKHTDPGNGMVDCERMCVYVMKSMFL